MGRESGYEGQAKPVEHHEEQKQRTPGWRDGTKLRERIKRLTQGEPSVVLPDVVQAPEVTPWLFLIQNPGSSLHKPQSALLTCRSRVTSVNW